MARVRNDGLAFELFSVARHAETYGHTVWHSSVMPEDALIRSGYVNDYNCFRLVRIARRREAAGQFPYYLDYGMDFLALDAATGLYYAGQCKNYDGKKVGAYDIATFVMMMASRFGRGFLYTTSDLLPVVSEDIAIAAAHNRYQLIHHNLRAEFDNDALSDGVQALTIRETLQPLRPCQVELIAAAAGPGVKVIKAPCGFGKTLCLGHILHAAQQYKLIFCVAPLRAHVDNLITRLTPFLPNHGSLLVDSDRGGTTNLATINSFLKTSKKPQKILYTTFKSMEELLHVLVTGDTDQYLIVDEAHNAQNRSGLCDVLNKFQNALYLSGTIPEDFCDNIDNSAIAYEYSIADGIRDGFLCDYEIVLPLMTPDEEGKVPHVDITIPAIIKSEKNPAADSAADSDNEADAAPDGDGISDSETEDAEDAEDAETAENEADAASAENTEAAEGPKKRRRRRRRGRPTAEEVSRDLLAKAFFLVSSMLKYGKRRCIVYLRNEKECLLFTGFFTRICAEYHAMAGWCETILYNVSTSERQSVIRDFQTLETHSLYVLTSIYILDEAVDIPKCDSEFITSLCYNPNELRIVQRLMRGSRLDPSNPNKKNHLFVWGTENSDIVNALSFLRDEDPNYQKKIYVRSGNYEKSASREIIDRELAAKVNIVSVVVARSRTYMEVWDAKRQFWIAQYTRLGRKPYASSKDSDEKRAAKWQNTIRSSKRRLAQTRYRLTEEQIRILDNTPGWTWEDDRFAIKRELWIAFYQKYKRTPTRCSKDPHEEELAIWQDMIRQIKKGLRKSAVTQEQLDSLNDVEGWIWENPVSFNKNYNAWVAYYKKHRSTPSVDSEDKQEKAVAIWQQEIRNTYHKVSNRRVLTPDNIARLNATAGWTW